MNLHGNLIQVSCAETGDILPLSSPQINPQRRLDGLPGPNNSDMQKGAKQEDIISIRIKRALIHHGKAFRSDTGTPLSLLMLSAQMLCGRKRPRPWLIYSLNRSQQLSTLRTKSPKQNDIWAPVLLLPHGKASSSSHIDIGQCMLRTRGVLSRH